MGGHHRRKASGFMMRGPRTTEENVRLEEE
eukprot:SAG11_NODE_37228_length_258_cov_0.534591_1_plen_29_part_10